MGSRARWIALLVAALFVGSALRFAVMDRNFPVRPLGDEMYYLMVASNLAEGRGHVYGETLALRPPAQSYLLSLFVPEGGLLGRGPKGQTVKLDQTRPLAAAQVALGTLLVVATALLAGALFGARAAAAAGLLAALYPTFIGYSHSYYSETLFGLLVTLGLAGVARGREQRSIGLAAVSGFAFGLAALTREIALPVAAMCVLWWGWTAPAEGRRNAWICSAVLLLATAATIAPWTLRNYSHFNRIVPVATVGWIAIGEGNSLEGARWLRPSSTSRGEFRKQVHVLSGEMDRADLARQLTLARVADAQPSWIFRKLAWNVPLLLTPDAFHFYKLRSGSYGDVSEATVAWLLVATTFAYAMVFVGGVFGMLGAPGGRRLLPLLVLAAVIAVHVVANANSRFRMPWMPLFMAYAGFVATRPRDAFRALGAREWVAFACILALFFGVGASYFVVGPGA